MIDANDYVNIAPSIAAIETILYSIEDQIQEAVDAIVTQVDADLGDIASGINPELIAALEAAEVNLPGEEDGGKLDWSEAERLLAEVDAALAKHEDTVTTAAQAVVSALDVSIDSLVPSLAEIFAGVVSIFGTLIDGLLGHLTESDDLWQSASQTIGTNLEAGKETVYQWIVNAFDALTKAANERMGDPMVVPTATSRTDTGPAVNTGGIVEEYNHNFADQPRIVQAIINVATIAGGILPLLAARMTGVISGTSQASLMQALTTPLSTGELTHLVKLEAITKPWATEHAKRSGISPELFDLKMAATEQLLTTDSIMELWRRYGTDTVLGDLKKIGYSDVNIERLKLLSLSVPTASDVVRFLARDVFDPAAIAAGGLDADFDQKYNEPIFNAAGVDRDTALLYWMSHWSLPSPTMGYEMFHRDIITQAQLEDLLKLADYAPGWVSKMVDIAYNVPGRIDVRRMFQTGIIPDHAGLVSAYKRMGYSPDDSEILATFTEKLKSDADTTANERRSAPIAREIVRAFVVGSLSDVQAGASLVALGYDQTRADLMLREGEFGRARERDTKIRDAIGREYVRGFIEADEAQARLDYYGFDANESAFLLTSWQLDRELAEDSEGKKHAKDLSKSEIIAAYADRLLDRNGAVDALVSLGYDAQESGTLLAIEDAKEARADSKALEQAIRTQFLTRRIEASDARSALEGAGLQASRIAALLARWEVEREERRPDISNAQLERMLMQGVIDKDTLQDELTRRGYTDHDVNMLLTLWGTDVSIAADKLEEQRREFEIREKRLSEQGIARIGISTRGLDIKEAQFTEAQTGVQQRFDASQQQRADLQQARLDATSALATQRIAADTTRAAAAQEAAHQRQERMIQADQDRIQKQIAAAANRQAVALAAAQSAREDQDRIREQAQAAATERQRAAILAQADRQQRTIDAANARATQAEAARVALANQHATQAEQLVIVRAQLQQARDIRSEASRISTEARTEQQRIRTEQRASARKGILASDAAANASQLQASQLQQASAIAEVNARFAALQAEIATQRRQAALDAKQAAEAALAAATPVYKFLEPLI